MFKFFKYSLVTVLGAGALLAHAEAPESHKMKLSIGVSYRSIGEADYKSMVLKPKSGSKYYDGTVVTGPKPGSSISVDDGITQSDTATNPLGTLHSLHYGGTAGGSEDLEDTMGLVLGASTTIKRYDTFVLDFDLTLGVHLSESNDTLSGTAARDVFFEDATEIVEVSGELVPEKGGLYIANYESELNMFTLGAGLGARMLVGPVELKLSGGPTITVIDYDIEGSATPVYSYGAGEVSSYDDKGMDVVLGAYAGFEAIYPIGESTEISAGVRYDWAAQDLDTDLADFDLSGTSFELKAIFKF